MLKPGTLVKAAYSKEKSAGLHPTHISGQAIVGDKGWKDIVYIPGVCIVVKNILWENERYVIVYSQQLKKRLQTPEGYVSPITTKVEDAIREIKSR